jgi:diguanylate cyclase (GGDEF)-like protein
MTDQRKPEPSEVANDQNSATTSGNVAQLSEQADRLRKELAQLRSNLEQVRREYTTERATQLVEANEALVRAALHSESIAEAAVSSLADLARSIQRDTLTGTPNRALMLDRVESAIALARRHNKHIAILFLDLDDFKRINDTLGHAVGDALLQVAARRLESVVRESDTVSRHGGDEFLVLMSEVAQAEDASLIAEKILSAFAAPAQVGNHAISLSASIGIAVYPQDGEDAATLISRADVAMYRAKKLAGSTFQFFVDEPPTADAPQGQSDVVSSLQSTGSSALEEQNPRMQHLREANEQLVLAVLTARELEERAESKHRDQVKFIAMVAHELRNPLNPIRTAAELLKRVRNEALLADLQSIIERQVVHMAQLIDDLLDGSRERVGKFRIKSTTVDIVQIMVASIESCRTAIDTRRQRLRLQVPPGPIWVAGDPVRLAQIFSNLLDNASKYTLTGGDISLSLETHGNTALITIADSGVGVSPEALPHIFELFVQEDHALRLHSGGLGIGLAVVRDLVEAHGGNVVATSAGKGRGSEFVVSLPIVLRQEEGVTKD